MAVTVGQLAIALRLSVDGMVSTEQTAVLTRLLGVADAWIQLDASDAPEPVRDEAAIRFAAYLYEQPSASRGRSYAHAWANSGAASLVSRWVERRAVTDSGASSTSSTTGGTGGPGVDQTARTAAARALEAADEARAAARSAMSEIAAHERANNPHGITGGIPADGSITTGKLADGAVTTPKLADDAVTGRKIAAGEVATGHIADNAVTGPKIPSDAITSRHIGADQIGNSELAADAVDSQEIVDDAVLETKLAAAVRTKLNARTTGSGDDAYDWATEGNTDLIPVRKIPQHLSIVSGTTVQHLTDGIAGEKVGDIAVGYDASQVVLAEYVADTGSGSPGWQIDFTIPIVTSGRRGQTADQVRAIVANALMGYARTDSIEHWAIRGASDDIPGQRTFNGLFQASTQVTLPAANVTITFQVGNADDGNEADETDASATSFAISDSQAVSGAFIRARYTLERITLDGAAPHDIELQLQKMPAGTLVSKHNIKDEGTGAATFALADGGQYRWAVRVVTDGSYTGDVRVTDATYYSGRPLADAPIEHIAEAAVSAEAEKRQQQDAAIRTEIDRVEGLSAIVDALPAATVSRKTSIVWKTTPPYEQADSDAFVVPSSGFVQFVLGNLGATPIMRAEDCINREMTGIYTFGRDNVGIEFDSSRRAVLIAQRAGERSPLADDIAATTTGYVMLHWPLARSQDQNTPTALAALAARVMALENAPSGGGATLHGMANIDVTVVRRMYGTTILADTTKSLLVVDFGQGYPSAMWAMPEFSALNVFSTNAVLNTGSQSLGTDYLRYRGGGSTETSYYVCRGGDSGREVLIGSDRASLDASPVRVYTI